MVAATPGVVVNVPGGFERDRAVGVFGGEAGWLVEAGAQGAGGRLEVEARAVDEEDGVAVAQQREQRRRCPATRRQRSGSCPGRNAGARCCDLVWSRSDDPASPAETERRLGWSRQASPTVRKGRSSCRRTQSVWHGGLRGVMTALSTGKVSSA